MCLYGCCTLPIAHCSLHTLHSCTMPISKCILNSAYCKLHSHIHAQIRSFTLPLTHTSNYQIKCSRGIFVSFIEFLRLGSVYVVCVFFSRCLPRTFSCHFCFCRSMHWNENKPKIFEKKRSASYCKCLLACIEVVQVYCRLPHKSVHIKPCSKINEARRFQHNDSCQIAEMF